MDCNAARLLLPYRHSDGYLTDEVVTAIDAHVRDCPDCSRIVNAHRSFDRQVARTMRDVPVPPDLGRTISSRLATESNRLFRRQVFRWGSASVAALLLLITGWVWLNRPEPLDAESIAVAQETRVATSRDATQQWFRHRGFSVPLPPEFDYDLQVNHTIDRSFGIAAPRVTFLRDHAIADVYVLPYSRYRLIQESAAASQVSVEIYQSAENPKYVFVVVYRGVGVRKDMFLNRRAQFG
jgi:hypothetical protein